MTEIIAHRGNSAHAPENTLRAFREAVALGCDRIELDVQRSDDGVPFVFHDVDLERLTGVQDVACGLPWSELAELQVDADTFGNEADTRVPTLDTVLAEIGPQCPLYVEIKAEKAGRHPDAWRELTDACIEVVDAPHVIASFHRDVVHRCLDAGRPTVLITADPRRVAELTARERSALYAVSVFHERIDEAMVASCAAWDLPLWAWTIDRAQDFERLRRLGADTAWCTNDPAALGTWLDSMTRAGS